MIYKYKEYEHIFDTPAKRQQEMAIVSKIMELLNKNKYDNIYEFINKNQTYQDFLSKNEMQNVVKHFGNTLNEEDYKKIVDQIIKLTESKKSFDKENIKTTNIDGREYNTYVSEDNVFVMDNTNSNKSIERQLEDLQPTEERFQTKEKKENTEAMMQKLSDDVKITFDLKYLNQINYAKLNEQQKEIYSIASNYQLSTPKPIKVDINKMLIVDSENNIMQIKKDDDGYSILGDNSTEKNIQENENSKQPKTFQKTLTPSPNTIYSNNN